MDERQQKPRRSLLQLYLAVVMTIVALLLAAILSVLIYVSIVIAHSIQSVNNRANGLSTKIDSFNSKLDNLNPFQ